ncbi:antitoxin [Actinomycetaceae bacterium MB13-C1-2]|nr:antitoxin [Actinomycetaceae bacterium MB13-C1-2]
MAEAKAENPLASILAKAQEALGLGADANEDAVAKAAGIDLSSLGLNAGSLNELLKSDQAEAVSDKILDALEQAAKGAAPDKKAAIETIRDQIDRKIGNE